MITFHLPIHILHILILGAKFKLSKPIENYLKINNFFNVTTDLQDLVYYHIKQNNLGTESLSYIYAKPILEKKNINIKVNFFFQPNEYGIGIYNLYQISRNVQKIENIKINYIEQSEIYSTQSLPEVEYSDSPLLICNYTHQSLLTKQSMLNSVHNFDKIEGFYDVSIGGSNKSLFYIKMFENDITGIEESKDQVSDFAGRYDNVNKEFYVIVYQTSNILVYKLKGIFSFIFKYKFEFVKSFSTTEQYVINHTELDGESKRVYFSIKNSGIKYLSLSENDNTISDFVTSDTNNYLSFVSISSTLYAIAENKGLNIFATATGHLIKSISHPKMVKIDLFINSITGGKYLGILFSPPDSYDSFTYYEIFIELLIDSTGGAPTLNKGITSKTAHVVTMTTFDSFFTYFYDNSNHKLISFRRGGGNKIPTTIFVTSGKYDNNTIKLDYLSSYYNKNDNKRYPSIIGKTSILTFNSLKYVTDDLSCKFTKTGSFSVSFQRFIDSCNYKETNDKYNICRKIVTYGFKIKKLGMKTSLMIGIAICTVFIVGSLVYVIFWFYYYNKGFTTKGLKIQKPDKNDRNLMYMEGEHNSIVLNSEKNSTNPGTDSGKKGNCDEERDPVSWNNKEVTKIRTINSNIIEIEKKNKRNEEKGEK